MAVTFSIYAKLHRIMCLLRADKTRGTNNDVLVITGFVLTCFLMDVIGVGKNMEEREVLGSSRKMACN